MVASGSHARRTRRPPRPARRAARAAEVIWYAYQGGSACHDPFQDTNPGADSSEKSKNEMEEKIASLDTGKCAPRTKRTDRARLRRTLMHPELVGECLPYAPCLTMEGGSVPDQRAPTYHLGRILRQS